MADQGVSAIPDAALNAIEDPNIRAVLTAIVEGINVRNGYLGNGSSRYITAGDIKQAGAIAASSNPIPIGNLPAIINDLQAITVESQLFKKLGKRVDKIDLPGGQISEEVTQRANSDNALVSAINTIWASVSGNSALVQGGAEVVANTEGAVATKFDQVQAALRDSEGNLIDSVAILQEVEAVADRAGNIEGKWAVTIDNNGYVTGFGLISSADNSEPYSEFGVRADKFFIASPAGPSIEPRAPFMVLTTPTSINGAIVPPGVYMNAAFITNAAIDAAKIKDAAITNAKIVDAAITTAKIGDLQVNTLKIADNSVTVPTTVTSSSGVSSGLVSQINVETGGGKLLIMFSSALSVNFNGGLSTGVTWTLQVDGANVLVMNQGYNIGLGSFSLTYSMSAAAGAHTISIYIERNGSNGTVTASTRCLSVIEAKK